MIAYDPKIHAAVGGTYVLKIGEFRYFGGTRNFSRRRSQHLCDLEQGVHPNRGAQVAFDACGGGEFEIIEVLKMKPGESDEDWFKRIKFKEQLLLNQHFGERYCLNLSSSSIHNTGIGDYMREKWKDKTFREKQVERMKLRRGDAITAETRVKLGERKRGANNPNARSCTVQWKGETMKFVTGQDAATHFGVTQQAMHNWLSGKAPWPGTGRKPARLQNRHLVGLTGSYD